MPEIEVSERIVFGWNQRNTPLSNSEECNLNRNEIDGLKTSERDLMMEYKLHYSPWVRLGDEKQVWEKDSGRRPTGITEDE